MAVSITEAPANPSAAAAEYTRQRTSLRPHIEAMFPNPLDVPQLTAIDSQAIPRAESAMSGGRAIMHRFATEDRSILIHRIVEAGTTVPTAEMVMEEVRNQRLMEQMSIVQQMGEERKVGLKRALGEPTSSDHLLARELQEGFAQEFGRHLFDEYRMAGMSLRAPESISMPHNTVQDMVTNAWQRLLDLEDQHEEGRKERMKKPVQRFQYGSNGNDIAAELQAVFVAREAVRFGDRPVQPLSAEPTDIFVAKNDSQAA